jgi:t-SNARE complex subunit (syntaxin)
MSASRKIYEFKTLFYSNCSGDEKTHLINVLNRKLQIGKIEKDFKIQMYYDLLHHLNSS